MTQKQELPMVDVIDVFSADCPLCEDAIQAVKDAVQSCGCTVRERPWEEGPQQLQYIEGGAYPVPSILVGGRVIFDGVPDRADVSQLQRSFRQDACCEQGCLCQLAYGDSLHLFRVTSSGPQRLPD